MYLDLSVVYNYLLTCAYHGNLFIRFSELPGQGWDKGSQEDSSPKKLEKQLRKTREVIVGNTRNRGKQKRAMGTQKQK